MRKKNQTKLQRANTLRRRAEKQLGKAPRSARPAIRKDPVELLHELEVHQVELELQNEELRRSQAALEESRKKYFDLYDLAPNGYVSLDRTGRIMEVNLTGANLLWTERRRLIGRPFWRYVIAGDRGDFRKFFASIFQRGNRAQRVFRLGSPGGAPTDAMLSGVAIEDGAGCLSLCQIAITDITPIKRVQERERLAAIGQTAATLVHEISNPLNGMLINLEFLQRSFGAGVDESAKFTLSGVVKELSRLSALLRDFSKLSRRERFSFTSTSLAALITEVIDAERSKLSSEDIQIDLKIDAGLPQVLADAAKIKQALINLCKNAEEAMPDGGTLTLRAYQSPGKVIVEVRDTGVGIAKNLDLSEPFITSKTSGTGLGLMIVRQLMAVHQGFLSYASEPGKGASFFLHFPTHYEH